MVHVTPLNADPERTPDIGLRDPLNPWEVGTYAAHLPLDTCHACMIGACIQRYTLDVRGEVDAIVVHGTYGST